MGYVFYCSKCRLDHAGECSPAAGTIVPSAVARVTLVNGIPAVGSRWKIQRRDSRLPSGWTKPGGAGDSKTYEVLRVAGSRVWIRAANDKGGYGTEYEYDLRPWTEEGISGWRMAPAP